MPYIPFKLQAPKRTSVMWLVALKWITTQTLNLSFFMYHCFYISCGFPSLTVLVCTEHTKPQREINKDERKRRPKMKTRNSQLDLHLSNINAIRVTIPLEVKIICFCFFLYKFIIELKGYTEL